MNRKTKQNRASSSAKPYTSLLDERRGIWTKCTIDADRVVFSRSRPKSHWIVTLAGLLLLIFLFVPLVQSGMGTLFLIAVLIFAIWQWWDVRKSPSTRLPIVLTKYSTSDREQFKHGPIYDVAEIKKIIVQENQHRDHDDTALIQIYLQLRDSEKLILLYQDYHAAKRIEQTHQIADQLRDWIANAREK